METNDSVLKIKFIPNGPMVVEGNVEMTLLDGTVVKKDRLHLCRCGATENKPYCDGSHAKVGFKG